jgi:hypothetical protein
MGTGLTVRSTGSGTQASVSRPGSTLTPHAVSTDLPTAQTVTAVGAAADARNDTTRTPSPDPSYMRNIVLDPQSREVIYRSVNAGLPRVVRQTPEVAAQRLKAYARLAKDDAAPHEPQADIEV